MEFCTEVKGTSTKSGRSKVTQLMASGKRAASVEDRRRRGVY